MSDDSYYGARSGSLAVRDTSNLADILERILDKGIVVAGDISINLVDIELLTIKVRLLIASVDKAREMGIDWWENDPFLGRGSRSGLDRRLRRLEQAAGLEEGRADRDGAEREADEREQ